MKELPKELKYIFLEEEKFKPVTSTQKVLFSTLFKIGSKYFLCTNHIS